ncbi:hypothetical protein ONS95_004708 [Cadophora gregata]|uniref:uncharacterized protein n=1 Tax=Cadophora gregata TaxID=51156 RepID=UPI0026DD1DCC|nr:uncharacterized protein ONS95_004708 [Cadophora gregata]KAK0104415.1 hypothetical protein ONS95_004708 [Cadophora gregata]
MEYGAGKAALQVRCMHYAVIKHFYDELRHAALSGDAMIWCLGPFNDPIYTTFEDQDLKTLADHMYFKLSAHVRSRHYDLIAPVTDVRNSRDEVLALLNKEMTLSMKIRDSNDGKLLVPKIFRDLYEEIMYSGGCGIAKKVVLENFALDLRSHLSIGNVELIEAGKDVHDCQDHFLLNMLEANDYPWDSSEIDW